MYRSICDQCGNPMDYPEGWHYCCECDIETYFIDEDNGD